jgi:hypothetical protein
MTCQGNGQRVAKAEDFGGGWFKPGVCRGIIILKKA